MFPDKVLLPFVSLQDVCEALFPSLRGLFFLSLSPLLPLSKVSGADHGSVLKSSFLGNSVG